MAITARGALALLILIAVVAGLPAVLYRFGGDPLPRHWPGLHQISSALLHKDNGTLFLGAVRDVSWIAWALFTIAVLAEAQAALRGRKAPRLRLGGLQSSAGWLVAITALAFSSQSAATLLAVPAAAAATVVASPQHVQPAAMPGQSLTLPLSPAAAGADAGLAAPPAAAGYDGPVGVPQVIPAAQGPGTPDSRAPASAAPDSQVMNMAFSQLVTVRPGDCLWTIAQRYLGAGDRYPEIVRLNLGHNVGHGQVFSDPSMIWAGWVLQLPTGAEHGSPAPAPQPSGSHPAHRVGDQHFGHPHSGAGTGHGTASGPAGTGHSGGGAGAGRSAHPQPSPATPPSDVSPGPAAAGSGNGQAGQGSAAHSGTGHSGTGRTIQPTAEVPEPAEIPPLAVFAAGMLAGGAGVLLAGLRHRQRQARRPGRRIALPASAPVMMSEQRLRSATPLQPATALRAALSDLGVSLLESGRQLPDLAGIRLLPTGMEVLLASPAIDPPPPPFTVPGGRQGMAWQLALPEQAPTFPFGAAEAGDLMPGLFTVGLVEDGGYLLLDPEYLRVTAVDGPEPLAERVLSTAAAELATSQLAGWYDLILVGFDELEPVAGRMTCCANLEEALDLLASKAVALRRRLGDIDNADIRLRRLTQPGDEDWALSLLVSRVPPTAGQLALLVDLASDPGGIAAVVAAGDDVLAGHPPVSVLELSEDLTQPGGIAAHISPVGLDAWPQPLTHGDYQALGSMFMVAAGLDDIAADAPPYDGAGWPPDLDAGSLAGLPAWLGEDEEEEPGDEPGDGEEAGGLASGQAAGLYLVPAPDPDPGAAPEPAAALTQDTALLAGDQEQGYPAAGDPGQSQEPPQASGPGPEPAIDLQGEPPPTGQATLRVGVLGTFTINGSPGSLLPAQSQLVLALALNGGDGLSNQQLCYLLGADPDHPKPTDSLRQLIVRTRRQLGRAPDGREWIEHLGAGQYALHPDARFDWADFEYRSEQGIEHRDAQYLRDALSLIRGQPFTGCYHWWLDLAFTETVRAQIVDTAETLSGLELAAGDPAASARAARTGLAGDATAEQLWRALMRAEYAAGNLSGVRDAWSRCLDAIADIAPDGEPHPETAAVYHQLISGKHPHPAWTPG